MINSSEGVDPICKASCIDSRLDLWLEWITFFLPRDVPMSAETPCADTTLFSRGSRAILCSIGRHATDSGCFGFRAVGHGPVRGKYLQRCPLFCTATRAYPYRLSSVY